jgi:hypothetical protein
VNGCHACCGEDRLRPVLDETVILCADCAADTDFIARIAARFNIGGIERKKYGSESAESESGKTKRTSPF